MTEAEIGQFLRHEARLLDTQCWDEWLDLFAEDGRYWVPLARGQADGIEHTSLADEDMLLLRLRIERLKRGAPSLQPPSHSQHVLQPPDIAEAGADAWRTRTPFVYAEARGDAMIWLAGTVEHHLARIGGAVKIRLKRINLLNCDAALPSIQLFL
jgi:3-phenylpropionate/cinnamic acid dioxygenase small subunit